MKEKRTPEGRERMVKLLALAAKQANGELTPAEYERQCARLVFNDKQGR